VVLQQIESLGGRGGLAAQNDHLNDCRQRVDDQKECGDSADTAQAAQIAGRSRNFLIAIML
jgi:hypothetical protein